MTESNNLLFKMFERNYFASCISSYCVLPLCKVLLKSSIQFRRSCAYPFHGQTHRWTDMVIPIYPQNFVFGDITTILLICVMIYNACVNIISKAVGMNNSQQWLPSSNEFSEMFYILKIFCYHDIWRQIENYLRSGGTMNKYFDWNAVWFW